VKIVFTDEGKTIVFRSSVNNEQTLFYSSTTMNSCLSYNKGSKMNSQKIEGTTRITGLLGNPVKHSISPIIHNHAFNSLNLDYCYIPLGCDVSELGALIGSLRALNFAGANVTIPYKSEIIQYCDEVSELSQITGTVNTLYYKDETLCGTTTDGEGFLRALAEDNFDPAGKRIVILGNGGTARTLAIILAYKKIPSLLTILGRNTEKVDRLVEEVKDKTRFATNGSTINSEFGEKILREADLVINCTPVGMSPNTNLSPIILETMQANTYYFDAIYNPVQTLFLKNAESVGASFQNGLQMLLFQGLESFTHWTGEKVPLDIFSIEELYSAVNGDR